MGCEKLSERDREIQTHPSRQREGKHNSTREHTDFLAVGELQYRYIGSSKRIYKDVLFLTITSALLEAQKSNARTEVQWKDRSPMEGQKSNARTEVQCKDRSPKSGNSLYFAYNFFFFT